MRTRELQQHRQRCLHSHQTATAEEMAPVHPTVRSLLGFTNGEILEVAKDVYSRWYQVAPSIPPFQCQDQLMGDLNREVGWQMMRAGLHDAAGGRACSQACSWSQAQSPLVGTSRWEGAKWPQEDSTMRHSWPRHRHSCNRSRPQWHQSTSLGDPLQSEMHSLASPRKPPRHVSPSLSPSHYGVETNGYTTLSAACVYSHSSMNPQREK